MLANMYILGHKVGDLKMLWEYYGNSLCSFNKLLVLHTPFSVLVTQRMLHVGLWVIMG